MEFYNIQVCPYWGWNGFCGWRGDTDEHPCIIFISNSYSAYYLMTGWNERNHFDVWGAVRQRRKIGLCLSSWMSSTVAVGQYWFLNYVPQSERCGIAFTLQKCVTSPTKSFTSLMTTERPAQIFFLLHSIFLFHNFLSLLSKRH